MGLHTTENMQMGENKQATKETKIFGIHPAGDNTFFYKLAHFQFSHFRDQRTILTTDTYHITQEDQFLRVERTRQMGRYEVRVDIQARAIWTLTKRGNNRDIRFCDQRLHKRWINRFDLTDKAKTFVGNPCPHHVAI